MLDLQMKITLTVLLLCLFGAARPSFLANIPQPKSNNTEEHERESIDRTDGDSAPPSWGGVLNPEVQDMLHGPVVNDTYLHKVDSDDVTETKDTNFPHNNSTDVVDSPHVEDPGSTHLEEEINDSGNITAGSSANTEDSTNNTSYKSQDVNPPTNDTVVAGQEAQSAASPSQSQSNIVGPIVAELNTTGSGNITASPSTNLSSSDAEVVNANTSAVEHSEAEDSNTANSGVDSEATFNKTISASGLDTPDLNNDTETVPPVLPINQTETNLPVLPINQTETIAPMLPINQNETIAPMLPINQTETIAPVLPINQTETIAPVLPINQTETIVPVLPINQTETIASVLPINQTENLIMGQGLALSSEQHAEHDHLSAGNHPTFLQPSESAGILAGVFVGLALLGYVGLLVWRRILEKRYGNREMLVNEDDFYDTSDLKHFEL